MADKMDKSGVLADEVKEPITVVIEPCPFCGHRPVLRVGKFITKPVKRYIIGCVNLECEMWVRTKFMPTIEEAIMAWNKRVTIADMPVGMVP